MKTDRELLELAAKAAGMINVFACDAEGREVESWWRPLTDDGDALRLAAEMRLSIDHVVTSRGSAWVVDGRIEEIVSGDLCSSLRRAIVRAAAAIGEAMP